MEKFIDVDTDGGIRYSGNPVKPNYSFETFIDCENNRVARSSCLAVTERLGDSLLNPLLIYGEPGLGKTHLAQAIYNKLNREKDKNKVIYIGSERFLTQYSEAVRNNDKNNHYAFYMQFDTLIFDDLQYLSGKSCTQQLLVKIFDEFLHSNKQIVLTTSVLPKNYKKLDKKLASRSKGGLTVCLQKPNYEVRLEVAKFKLKFFVGKIPENALIRLAQRLETDIRVLEGVIVSLIYTASILKKEIDIEMVDEMIDKFYRRKKIMKSDDNANIQQS